MKCRAAPQIRLRRLRRGLYTPESTEDLANLEIVRLATHLMKGPVQARDENYKKGTEFRRPGQ